MDWEEMGSSIKKRLWSQTYGRSCYAWWEQKDKVCVEDRKAENFEMMMARNKQKKGFLGE